MSQLLPGSYVTHAKLPELGCGEILSSHDDKILIRFASGDRSFRLEIAARHLTVTTEAPPPAAPAKASRKKKS